MITLDEISARVARVLDAGRRLPPGQTEYIDTILMLRNALFDEGVGLLIDVDTLAKDAEGSLFMGLPIAKMNRKELLAVISVLASQIYTYQEQARKLWGENIGGEPPVGIIDLLGLEVGTE